MTKQFRLTRKGQVTVPKDVRDALGIGPGDAVTYGHEGDKVVLRKAEEKPFDREARIAEMRARIERARRLYPPIPMDMPTDEYMAMIREPVPLRGDDDDIR